MAIPAVVQGTIETEDGKVFELDSPKGAAWVEAIGSFRFEPVGDSKPCTVRKEPSGYWYGCRKVAGKVRKKYIGKSSEINTAKLEGIAAALEVPPVQRVNKVAEVVQGVAEVAQVAEVTQDRLTALELEVASLRKALEALQEALPEKLESGDSAELPKVDNKVVEGLHNGLSNLDVEPEDVEFLKRLLAKKDPLISSDLWQEIERLKERNRQLRLKMRAERQESIEKISDLEDWNKGLTRRVQEKQARLDELEVTETELQNELSNLKTENENLRQALESLKQELAENTRYYTARLNEAGATIGTFKDKLEAAQAKNQRLQIEIGNLQAEREEIAQIKKELKEAAAELHREERSLELEKARWQGQISDAKSELADAKATILAQGNKIRELERGYSFKPNPKESALRLEIGELREQLEQERASREETEAKLSEFKQNFAPAATLSEKLAPDAATILSQLRAKRKKSPVSLTDIEKILEIIEES